MNDLFSLTALQSERPFDVVVVGAGAAGLVAGFRAAERGLRVLVLEKNAQPGVKILMSGGTRCNLTQATDNRGIVRAFGPPGKFLHSALAALSVADSIAMFHQAGVPTKVESTGKVFPASDRARDVLAALLARLHRSGAQLALGEPAEQLVSEAGHWQVVTTSRRVGCAAVILTTGGSSYPASGTTGDGYRLASAWGHTIVPPRPALAPLTTSVSWCGELRGVTLPDVNLTLRGPDGPLATRRGSLLFAHFGLTGPVALDVSREVSRHPRPQELVAEIDLLPTWNDQRLSDYWIESARADGRRTLAVAWSEHLPRRVVELLLAQAQVPPGRRFADLSRAERQRFSSLLKAWPIPISGTLGFRKAEVTAGGVALNEVDSRDMQSKLAPGLFLAGEVLDLDGPIGGYNFQAAWSTGWLAGSSVCQPTASGRAPARLPESH